LKSSCVLQDHNDDERDKAVFHNTSSDLQDQDLIFLVSDRSCPKIDGLGPNHCAERDRSGHDTTSEWINAVDLLEFILLFSQFCSMRILRHNSTVRSLSSSQSGQLSSYSLLSSLAGRGRVR